MRLKETAPGVWINEDSKPLTPLFPGVPDLHSLNTARQMGYTVTPTGLCLEGLCGRWLKPNSAPFPMPAFVRAQL